MEVGEIGKTMNSKYNYAIVVGVVTFVGLLVLFFAVIKPLYENSAKSKSELTTKEAHLSYLKDKKIKLDGLKDRKDELEADAEKVSAALPSEPDAGRLFMQFDQIATDSKGVIKSVSQNASTGTATAITNNLSKISFAIPLDIPGYLNFKDLITNSETALRVFEITGIDLKTGKDGSNITANLNVTTFMRSVK